MEQSIFNWIAGGVIGAIGWFARMLWDRQELQARELDSARSEHAREVADVRTESAKAVAEVRVHLAGNFVTHGKLAEVIGDVKEDLRYIRDKLDETPQRRAGDRT